jgi:hypothetical protein
MKKELKNKIPIPSCSSFNPATGEATAGGDTVSTGFREGNLDEALIVLSFEAHLAMTLTEEGKMADLLLFEIEGYRPNKDVEVEERVSLLFPMHMTSPIVSEILKVFKRVDKGKPVNEKEFNSLVAEGFEPIFWYSVKDLTHYTTEEALAACATRDRTQGEQK